MLGKLIKNEFINRGAQVALILLGIVLISGVEGILLEINERADNLSTYFKTFVVFFSIAYGFIMFAGLVAIAYLTMADFGKRLFKDQGYLTHTLPVKTSSIMLSRMVCDLTVMLALAITFPLALSIALRDFSFYKEIIDVIDNILKSTGSVADKSLLIGTLIAFFAGIFISTLFSLWMFNGAYALGHMFNKNKRTMSVVFFIVILLVVEIISIIIVKFMDETRAIDLIVEDSTIGNIGEMFIVVLASDAIMLIAVAIMAAITSWVCKNKLNLE